MSREPRKGGSRGVCVHLLDEPPPTKLSHLHRRQVPVLRARRTYERGTSSPKGNPHQGVPLRNNRNFDFFKRNIFNQGVPMPTVNHKFDDLLNPVINALKALGGSGTNQEINDKVAEIAKIPTDQLDILHDPEKGGLTEIEYRLMWTRTYLKTFGIIDNSVRGVWAFTEKGAKIDKVDEKEVVRFVRAQSKKNKRETSDIDEESPNDVVEWQGELLEVIQNISPAAFERLIQRLLRESGFI